MSKRIYAAALLVVVAGCAQLGGKSAPDPASDREAIGAILEEVGAAHRAGDAERWAALFASDAILMTENGPSAVGRESMTRMARDVFRTFTSTAKIEPVELEVGGDWAFARTSVSGTFTPKAGGAPIQLDGKEIVIFRRQSDGTWKIARLIGNSNRPRTN